MHLTLTVFTDFKYRLIKLIPFKVHGILELLVAIILIVSPLFLGSFTEYSIDKFFFCGFGVAVLLAGAFRIIHQAVVDALRIGWVFHTGLTEIFL